MKTLRQPLLSLLAVLLLATPALANAKKKPKEVPAPDKFTTATKDLALKTGLLNFYVDAKGGKILLEVPASAADEPIEVLYVEGLATGLGSNPIGIDRAQLGRERLVHFKLVGGKLIIEHQNLGFRAISDNPLEVRAVRDSFATSVLWAGPVTATAPDGRSLVDITSFLLADAHNVVATLKRAGQGSFKLDGGRSLIDPEACLAFPDNIELEALLTYSSAEPGMFVQQTSASGDSVTLRQHHSFIRLPDDDYTPRAFDPRGGNFAISYSDYATPLEDPLVKRFIVRHRLEKTDPNAASSTVKEPIVYYVDSGAPPQIQQALLDGARWWADAFTAAGFIDAFKVELMPPDAHPLDVRYNLINWVHRSTRGWSYGGGITDPRTGEMIKGQVSLGSLRVRQDRLIFEGLAGADRSGSGDPDDPVEVALARIRQLSAHEVGHTLGITHNFAASTYQRGSVMDYPAPYITLGDDGELDFSEAYAVGIGEWDKHAVRFAYSQFAPGADEAAELDHILDDGIENGLLFISDADARPDGAAHPLGNLWDNGEEPVAELERLSAVRAHALENFSERSIAVGQPISTLHEALVPIYFLHRFQIRAAAKVVGGLDYSYAVRGDASHAASHLDPEWQRGALNALLDLVEPEALDLPEDVLALLLPRPFGYRGNREMFGSSTSPTFDALGAAATLSKMVSDLVIQPQRLARLVDHHRRDAAQPALEEVLSTVTERIFLSDAGGSARQQELQRTVQSVFLSRMLDIARTDSVPPRVRYAVASELESLRTRLATLDADGAWGGFRDGLAGTIERFETRSESGEVLGAATADAPPGQPIGSGFVDIEQMDDCSWSLDYN
jgi:hypothetical protein